MASGGGRVVVVEVVVVLGAGNVIDALGAIVERVSIVMIAGSGRGLKLGQRDPISEIIDIIVTAITFMNVCSGKVPPVVGGSVVERDVHIVQGL